MRGSLLGAAVAVVAAWSALQFWLAHRAFAFMDAQAHARTAAWYAAHPGVHLTVTYVPNSYWVHAGTESVASMLLVGVIAAALAVGGRGWWTPLVAAFPAAVAVGRFQDGTTIGQGWNQPTTSVRTWLAAGVTVDTITLLVVSALLVTALASSRKPVATASTSTLFRAAPAAVILVGWWLVRHPIADPADRVWLAQTVVWVVVVALLAGSSLPLALRAVAVGGLMPLFSFTILDDLLGASQPTFDGTRYLHHLAVAAGIAVYVAGVPALIRRARTRSAPSPAAAKPA